MLGNILQDEVAGSSKPDDLDAQAPDNYGMLQRLLEFSQNNC